MERVIVIMSPADLQHTQQAAHFMRNLFGQIQADATRPHFLIVPPEVMAALPAPYRGAGDGDAAAVLGFNLYGGRWVGTVASPLEGLAAALAACEPDDVAVVVRSDVRVSPLFRALATQGTTHWPVVVPVGPQFGGGQRVELPEGVDGFQAGCQALAGQHAAQFLRVDVPEPYALGLRVGKVAELGGLDTSLGDLGWALRDLALRCRRAGLGAMAAAGVYAEIVGHDALHPHAADPGGRLRYYAKHGDYTQGEHRLAATWIVQPSSPHQLRLLRDSIESVAPVVDLLHLVLVDHPGRFEEGAGQLSERERRYLKAMAEPEDPAEAGRAFARWVTSLVDGVEVQVDLITDYPTIEVLERLAAVRTQAHGATWCLRLTEGDTLVGVTRPQLDRLMRHPDPMVTAYNVGIAYAWDTLEQVREDPPFGDGGSLRGDEGGSNDWRLFRCDGGPRRANDGGRASFLRLRNLGLVDSHHRSPKITQEGMRISRWSPPQQIGLQLLAYPGEDPDAVARWLDWTHGLTSGQAVSWTVDEDPAPLFAGVFEAFRATVVRADAPAGERFDFAAWRNLGLETIRSWMDAPAWIWTVDPDEWLDPVGDLIAVRRMTETRERLAYLFEFRNFREDRSYNLSGAVRMHRTELGLRFVGRVHETIDGIDKLVKHYGDRAIGRAPFQTRNTATATAEAGRRKQPLYRELLRLELQERPDRAQPWILLGYQYEADGHHDLARACHQRAIELSTPTAYLAWYELGMHHARHALQNLRQAVARLPEGHHHRAGAEQLLEALQVLPEPMPANDDEPEPLPAGQEG